MVFKYIRFFDYSNILIFSNTRSEQVFKYGDAFCIRKHIATLRPGQKLYYFVIDVWSALMNEKETYKSAESPSRLFFNIALSVIN